MIVDASVAAKWCLPDEYYAVANRLLERIAGGKVSASVPDLFWPEMTNLLAHAARSGRISAADAESGLQHLHALGLSVIATQPLAGEALRLAVRWQRPAYDLFYVVAASSRSDELVTADQRLLRALSGIFPVRWLGAAL